jgi:hypothetical protein
VAEFALFMAFLSHGGVGLEWMLAAIGIFGVARAARRRSKPKRLPPHPVTKEVRPPLPKPIPIDTRRLPASVRLKVAQIRRKIDDLLKYSDRFQSGSEIVYVLRRMATDYLPSTLQAYLAIPPGSETLPVNPEGKTAWQVLWEQLTLMEKKLDEIAADLHRKNADKLVANGRFLEERFKQLGSSELNLDKPSADDAGTPSVPPDPNRPSFLKALSEEDRNKPS